MKIGSQAVVKFYRLKPKKKKKKKKGHQSTTPLKHPTNQHENKSEVSNPTKGWHKLLHAPFSVLQVTAIYHTELDKREGDGVHGLDCFTLEYTSNL